MTLGVNKFCVIYYKLMSDKGDVSRVIILITKNKNPVYTILYVKLLEASRKSTKFQPRIGLAYIIENDSKYTTTATTTTISYYNYCYYN